MASRDYQVDGAYYKSLATIILVLNGAVLTGLAKKSSGKISRRTNERMKAKQHTS